MHKMKPASIPTLAAILLFLAGCSDPEDAFFQAPSVGAATPWTKQVFKADPNDFQFAVVSDRTGGARPGVFERAMVQLNLLQPEFVLSVGDLIQGYTEDLEVMDLEFDGMDYILSDLEMRFFRVVGNHDVSNPVMLKVYRKRYGLSYYHFLYKNVLFLLLYTEKPDEGRPGLDDTQITYMEKVLRDNRDARWTFVFMHHPLFVDEESGSDESWARMENALAGRPHTVFAGHVHHYAKYEQQGRSYIHLATTGGGSKLRGIEEGEFDHLVWVTMTDRGPIITNLMMDGIFDENIRVP